VSYKQLTQEQRYQIYALKQADQPGKRIAEIVGVHASTISRELKRNRGKKGYRPKQAHQKAQARKHGAKRRIGMETWEYIDQKLTREWSPEQVSGRLRSHHQTQISPEWIYQHILSDQAVGGSLYQHLRCQKRKRKRYGSQERRGSLPNRRSMDERPLVVKALQIEYFFAHPFSAWERGTHENTNGLIRQYFPKQSAFTTITPEEVKAVMEKLNNRPRKCLGFKTPNEIYQSCSFALVS
jgi:IS30 family transposase